MTVTVKGRPVALPWDDRFDRALMRASEQTYRLSGEDLLHEIHKQAIEANLINIRLYNNLMTGIIAVSVLQIAVLAYLVYKLGL